MFDLANEILQTMRNNKLRTALTGLSVAWGIFMLITLVSAAGGITYSFQQNMLRGDNQKMLLWGGSTSKPSHGYREGRNINLKNEDMDMLAKRHNTEVKQVTSEIYGTASRVSTNTTYVDAGYTGVFPETYDLEQLTMVDGRFLSDKDLKEQAKVMVLSEEYAKQLFPPDGSKAVGSRVNCNDLSFTVIGVYQGRFGRTTYIPYTTARVFSADKQNVGQITLVLDGLDDIDQATQLETDVRNSMAAAHDFSPDDRAAVWIWNAVEGALTIKSGISILNIGVWVLGLLTLLSGIIGISNIMFVSVKERTHEIGIRRAIGAKPSKILTQILTESIVITTLFGYIGIVLGTLFIELLSAGIGDEMMAGAHVDLGVAAQVTVVLIVAGALAGLFPALKALKVKPVEALRDE